ncbi:hypothetical protein KBB96_18160 [Luteolibacter ambystomatis]|uniref:Uncharacterized protein n=1 Tax=Luteolibacter ambystomatis TaxID=2824561 RepID=A0A975IZC5_9BACT|nr:hypothetical protein [Luteolibacter ambystomatis]QUE50773.1 hypothetical protein KBB96_18160 [Luteolibacter ambystomatis]
MTEKDRNKLAKAGFATPRGGAKGAYQNHVVRSNRVIVPFEKLGVVPLDEFRDGYVVRLFPDQYFQSRGLPKREFVAEDAPVKVGENAFILYGSHAALADFPPIPGWRVRRLLQDGVEVAKRRGVVTDDGHYVLRIPKLGRNPKRVEGPPQGIFAPEYAHEEANFLSKCVLAWLIIHSVHSPYTTHQASHLREILRSEGLLSDRQWESRGVMRHALTACPLCTRFIRYGELHDMLALDEEDALENAGLQVEGATRSTIVNLFHLEPLRYDRLDHVASSVAWGHATCNTKLGQRKCYSIEELIEQGAKVGLILEDTVETFGWLSPGWEMLRSARGAVWIRICPDRGEGVDEGPLGPPAQEEHTLFDQLDGTQIG